jgi:hypothetical protein
LFFCFFVFISCISLFKDGRQRRLLCVAFWSLKHQQVVLFPGVSVEKLRPIIRSWFLSGISHS